MVSVSKTLGMALMSNRIAYFGNVFLPLFMFMIFLNYDKVNYLEMGSSYVEHHQFSGICP